MKPYYDSEHQLFKHAGQYHNKDLEKLWVLDILNTLSSRDKKLENCEIFNETARASKKMADMPFQPLAPRQTHKVSVWTSQRQENDTL